MRVLIIISLLFSALCAGQNPLASVSSLTTDDYALLSYSYTVDRPLSMDYKGILAAYDRSIHTSGVYGRKPKKIRTLRVDNPLQRGSGHFGWQEFNALLLRRYNSDTRALPQSD